MKKKFDGTEKSNPYVEKVCIKITEFVLVLKRLELLSPSIHRPSYLYSKAVWMNSIKNFNEKVFTEIIVSN